MRNVLLIGGLAWCLTAGPADAGNVVSLRDSLETGGKVSLNPSMVHVDGAAPADINLPDILEADFADAPFHLDYFSSVGDTSDQLPPGWKGVGLGNIPRVIPDTFSYAKGTFTVKGVGNSVERLQDAIYFVALPWIGNGVWTARLLPPDHATDTEGGLMVRENFDPSSIMFCAGLTGLFGNGQETAPGWACFRNKTGGGPNPRGLGITYPAWLRLTRDGASVGASFSTNGKDWSLVYQDTGKTAANAWAGFFVATLGGQQQGVASFDQVTFTPAPCEAQVLPPGVLLRSGSFLAGCFNPLVIDPAQPEVTGNFIRVFQNEKTVAIPASKIAAVTMMPSLRTDLAGRNATGLVMRNGDYMDMDSGGISGYAVSISSVVMGIVNYGSNEVRACVFHPMQSQSAPYEVRLTDGSSIRATGLSVEDGQLVIAEVSGITVAVKPEEIAQFRAGPAQVQPLLEVPWQATPPVAAAHADNPVPPATNTAPAKAASAAPATAAPNPAPAVTCWQGNSQEHIMVAPSGASIDFPLTGKYRAVAFRVAMSPDSPPKSEAVVHVLVDGREIARTSPVIAGDPPRFVEFTVDHPPSITLATSSFFAGTRVLLIDPVALRENPAPTP